mmetsp:Transcript_62912/g.116960  ORF Transcript_62912/g.116960 Transcript_62912/m.116960 type:complete len:169 (+) Transcript_62912:81-587(+)
MERSQEDVLEEVRRDGTALQDAPEWCRNDHEIVLTAVQQDGWALQWAAEACRSDREIALTAVRNKSWAMKWVADDLVEDESFASDAKQECFILKLTLLSGRYTYVCEHYAEEVRKESILRMSCRKLGLEYCDTMKLLHGTQEVPAEAEVSSWPGIRPAGQVTEYLLVV